jgi:hypothetical protein
MEKKILFVNLAAILVIILRNLLTHSTQLLY